MELYDFTETIKSKEDFEQFICMLLIDLKNESSDWENKDLSSFLRAMHDYAGSLKEKDQNGQVLASNQPSWRLFAELLMAARVYE
jgi:hypothetical protein